MPGWLDSIFSAGSNVLGSLFGGGGGVDPMQITPNVEGLVDTPGYLNAVGDYFNSGSTGGLDLSSLLGSFTSGGGGGGFNWGSLTPFDAQTVAGSDINPANITSNVPGLTGPNPFSGGGVGSLLGNIPPSLLQGLTGGAGGAGGGGGGGSTPAASGTPTQRPAQTPGATPSGGTGATPGSTGGGTPGGGILGGLGGVLGGLGGNGFSDILAAGGLLGSLLKKDSLGPGADQLTKMASDFGQRGQQFMDTAQANQQGHINDQALGRVERSLRQRQAAIRKSYGEMGMSGSTMEAQDLNDASQAADQEVFSIGQEMATTGLNTALSLFGDQQSITQNLLQDQIAQDKELSDAMAQFAAAAVRYDGTQGASPQGGGGNLAPRGTTPAGSTNDDLLNQILGFTNHPIDPALFGTLTPVPEPMTAGGGPNPMDIFANVPGLIPTGTDFPDPSAFLSSQG